MTVNETISRNQRDAVAALHHSYEAAVDLARPVFSATEPLWKLGRDLPMVDRLPTVRESIEQWYGFFEDVLKEQKVFLLRLEELMPGRPARTPVVKSTTPKAA